MHIFQSLLTYVMFLVVWLYVTLSLNAVAVDWTVRFVYKNLTC